MSKIKSSNHDLWTLVAAGAAVGAALLAKSLLKPPPVASVPVGPYGGFPHASSFFTADTTAPGPMVANSHRVAEDTRWFGRLGADPFVVAPAPMPPPPPVATPEVPPTLSPAERAVTDARAAAMNRRTLDRTLENRSLESSLLHHRMRLHDDANRELMRSIELSRLYNRG
ncbi:MAG: hypothetical protein ACOZIN_14375 [Myxococcota bacterium]